MWVLMCVFYCWYSTFYVSARKFKIVWVKQVNCYVLLSHLICEYIILMHSKGIVKAQKIDFELLEKYPFLSPWVRKRCFYKMSQYLSVGLLRICLYSELQRKRLDRIWSNEAYTIWVNILNVCKNMSPTILMMFVFILM